MTNETKILTALLDPNHTDHYLMHTTVGRNITIRHNGYDNVIIIEHGDKRIMIAMGKEDSMDKLIPFMRAKKGVREFDTYREPLTQTKSGEDGKGITSVYNFKIMERMTPLEQHLQQQIADNLKRIAEEKRLANDRWNLAERGFVMRPDNLDIPDVADGFVMRPVGSEYVVLDHSKIVIPETLDYLNNNDGEITHPADDEPHTTVADQPSKKNRQTWWGRDATKILDFIEEQRGNMSDFEVLEDVMCGSYVDCIDDEPHTTVADHPFKVDCRRRKLCKTYGCMQITEVDGEPFMGAVDNVCPKCMEYDKDLADKQKKAREELFLDLSKQRPSDAKLSQHINKEHMESHTGQTITDEAWEVFVDRLQDAFGEEVSQLAFQIWNDYDPMDWE